MQIDRYNHLQFPRDNAPASTGNESSAAAVAQGLTKPQARVSAGPTEQGVARSESVVLKIQWPDSMTSEAARGDAPVYSNARKAVARGDTDADSDNQAQEHQRAVDRNAGVFTQITLNKDGVLVAKPQAAAQAKQPDFVALAVSAMREFSDEAERQKVRSFDFNEAPAEMPWNKLKGLQQLAAKFNVFA